MGLLKFKVVSASDLKKADTFGKSDPYCVVFSGEAKIGKTTVQKKTLDPEWNADFELIFEENDEGHINTNTETLRFEIFDKDLIGSHDFLGMYELSGKTLLEFVASKTGNTKTLPLLEKDGSKGQGSITLAFTSYAKDEQISRDASKDRKNAIIIRIVRADDLKKADLFGKSDPYAKLFFNDIPVGETKVMKDNHFPIWNEDLEIQVPNGDIKRVGSGNLKAVVYDFDDVGKHDFLGQVELSGLNLLEMLLTRKPKTYNLVPQEVNTKDKSIKGHMILQCLGFVDENGNDVTDNPKLIGEVRKYAQKSAPSVLTDKGPTIEEKKTYLSEWPQYERLFDADAHSFFYFNNFSGKSSWKEPFDFGLEYRIEERLWAPPDPYVRSKAAQQIQRGIRIFLAKMKVRRKRAWRHKVAPKQVWTEAFDPQKRRKYFCNLESDKILWKRPMDMRTDMNRWIKSFDPAKKKTYFYMPIVGKVTYIMPENYTPGGTDKRLSKALKVQAAFRAYFSRCNKHIDKFMLRKFPVDMPLVFNPDSDIDAGSYELCNRFQSAVSDFIQMSRHRHTRKSARARSMVFDLHLLLEDIKAKYTNLDQIKGNNVNDEEVDGLVTLISTFVDQVANAIPILINEETDVFRVVRNRLREMVKLDVYRLQTPGLDDSDKALLNLRTKVDRAKNAVLKFQAMDETKYALTKLRSRRFFQGNYALFARNLRQVIKKVYSALSAVKSFMEVSGTLKDKRISQLELLRMRQEEAKQKTYILIKHMRAEKQAKHKAFVHMCQDKWTIGKEKRVIEEEDRIKTDKENAKKIIDDAKKLKVKRETMIVSKARDIASPWKAIRLDIDPSTFRELLQGEMERQVYQEKKRFSINSKCPETGETMPGNAVLFGKAKILRYLLQMRADPNLCDNGINKTALLHIAAGVDRPDMVRILLDHGATLCIKDSHGDTPLHIAVRKGHNRVVKELIRSSDPKELPRLIATPNYKGKLAIDLAQGKSQIFKLLKPYQKQALSVQMLGPEEQALLSKRAFKLKARHNFEILNPKLPTSRADILPKLDSGKKKKKKKTVKQEAPELMESEILRRKMRLVKKKYARR